MFTQFMALAGSTGSHKFYTDSKDIGRRTNVEANIGGTYGQMRTDGVYRREGTNGVIHTRRQKTRRQRYENYPLVVFVQYGLAST